MQVSHHRKTKIAQDTDAKERLRAALSIAKLLELYGDYAENHGFDNAIMEAGIHALSLELEAVIKLIEARGKGLNGHAPNGKKRRRSRTKKATSA